MKFSERQTSTRAGQYLTQPGGYEAFIPVPLPPADLRLDPSFLFRLSRADRALARLDGSVMILPNPDLFIFMYLRREALLSSQIEGTQASLMDVLEVEAEMRRGERVVPAHEVINYIDALNHGLERLEALPVSLRLIRELHERLMAGVRGGEPQKTPGEFRRSQNWIGGRSPETARFVPPPVPEMETALGDLEKYLHEEGSLPDLVQIGLIHAQFETVHPFLDGNGRIGRLLISLLLAQRGILPKPLLYLSIFFKDHRDEYYSRLQAVRDQGEWEEWLQFFLDGVAEVATQATETARQILLLREKDRVRIATLGRRSGNGHRLLDLLFQQPYVSAKLVERQLGMTQPTANALVAAVEKLGVLRETTGRKRDRRFLYAEYMDLFQEG
jgi:Fic family protein